MKPKSHVLHAIVTLVTGTHFALAAPLTPGNIIVSNSPSGDPRFFEFTRDGAQIQDVDIPSATEHRDLILDGNGNVAFYAGTFSPVLRTYDPITELFSSTLGPSGWSTINNLTYGGMAAFGEWVFATDMTTSGSGAPQGIVRFNVNNLTSVRFGGGNNMDLNVGLDGLLYALDRNASPAGTLVRVYDPGTMEFQRSFSLAATVRAIAIDEAGHVFAAQREPVSRVVHFDADGSFIDALDDPGIGGFGDIDIAHDGALLIASHGGVVLLTDTSLTDATFFNTRTSNGENFAAFVQQPVPEPSTLAMAALGVVGLLAYACRRRRRA